MHRLVRVLGGVLAVAGLGFALFGGYLEATGGDWVLCFWAGVLVAGLGMVLCGLIDWGELW